MTRALEEQRDFLLDALARLEEEHDAGVVDDADYENLRDDYTVRAANVLRALEAEGEADATTASSAPRGRRTALVVGLVAIALVIAVVVLGRSTSERGPGDSLTGGDEVAGQTVVADPEVVELLGVAQQLFAAQEYAEAIQTYDQVLERDPDNVEALTYRGWLLRLVAVGATDPSDRELLQSRAREALDRAVELEPTYVDARIFRAILLRDLGEVEAALADLDAVPPDGVPAFMADMVDQLRAGLEGTP